MKELSLKSVVGFLTITSVGLALSFPANAHEPRAGVAGGAYNIVVGHRGEPPFAEEPNRFDLFMNDPEGNPLNIPLEEMNIEVYVLLLRTDAIDARVRRSAKLRRELTQDRESPNRYNIWYKPTRAGAYGFHIVGDIQGNPIDEIFVCGGGSQNPDGRSFSCIERIQEFPRRRRRGGK